MNISTNDNVNDFLSDVSSVSTEQFNQVMLIREIFLNANSQLVENIKYGGLVFMQENRLIGGIYTYKQHISIEFSNGSDFTDSDSILEGKGKKRRHLKIYNEPDIDQKNSGYFIKQAVNNDNN